MMQSVRATADSAASVRINRGTEADDGGVHWGCTGGAKCLAPGWFRFRLTFFLPIMLKQTLSAAEYDGP